MDKSRIKDKSTLSKTISSESFLEKIILLIITVLLSGLLIPYVTSEIQRRKIKNDIILQAQSELLEDVSKTLLTYETLLADISWYKLPKISDTVMHEKAFQNYTTRSVELLAEWRVEAVKANNLSSFEMSDALNNFQLEMFRLQDEPMFKLHKKKGTGEEWENLHNINTQMLTKANQLIIQLAKEMKITKNSIK
jgi:hypothetical protein